MEDSQITNEDNGGSKKPKKKRKPLSVKTIIWLSVLAFLVLSTGILLIFSYLKIVYADFSKTELQKFVKVWTPIEKSNDSTIESDIRELNTETTKIKQEVDSEEAPANCGKLKGDIIGFFDYANTFTTEMNSDFEWSKELSVISAEDDQAIASIDFNDGNGPMQTTLTKAIGTMNDNITKMNSMKVSSQVSDAHIDFRDSVAEESALYTKLLTAVKTNDTTALSGIATEIKVFNEKFGEMSGPSSALTIAYAIKTKEFEIKIEKLGKEIDNASTLMLNYLE